MAANVQAHAKQAVCSRAWQASAFIWHYVHTSLLRAAARQFPQLWTYHLSWHWSSGGHSG